MATLKDHQQAMVDLLASGSGIPASASRLAHAMHDVLSLLTTGSYVSGELHLTAYKKPDATTPGLNDKALAGDIEACRPKTTPAERRVKELENTVKQLRASNANMRSGLAKLQAELAQSQYETSIAKAPPKAPEQAGRRRDDTQICEHLINVDLGAHLLGMQYKCVRCGDMVAPL